MKSILGLGNRRAYCSYCVFCQEFVLSIFREAYFCDRFSVNAYLRNSQDNRLHNRIRNAHRSPKLISGIPDILGYSCNPRVFFESVLLYLHRLCNNKVNNFPCEHPFQRKLWYNSFDDLLCMR